MGLTRSYAGRTSYPFISKDEMNMEGYQSKKISSLKVTVYNFHSEYSAYKLCFLFPNPAYLLEKKLAKVQNEKRRKKGRREYISRKTG